MAQNNKLNTLNQDVAYAYWNDICDNEPLSPDEQKRLIKLIQAGDRAAQDRFVESFLRLVVSRAKIYCHDFNSFMDLVQEGNIGLLYAIKHFDPDRGYCFSTYATKWIDKYIRHESCRTGLSLYVPDRMVEMANRLLMVEKTFILDHNRNPSVKELADILNTSTKEVVSLQTMLKPTLSLEHETDVQHLYRTTPDDNSPMPEDFALALDTKETLEKLMDQHLTPIESTVLKLRFGINTPQGSQTLDQVAQRCGITGEGVRKAEKRAIQKLHAVLMKAGLTIADFV